MTSKNDNPVKADYPYARSNVFLMMRFEKTKQQKKINDAISSVLAGYYLNPIRADSKHYQNELWANVKSCIDASDYGIAVFEQIDQRDINPNVSLELGYMLAQGKKCLLLKEKRVPVLQSDLVGHLYREFDSHDIIKTVTSEVRNWLRDLGFIKKSDEKMIVFVSGGGTCRCAMAKAITKKIAEKSKLNFKLRVESCAKGNNTSKGGTHENPDDGATDDARQAINKFYKGEDLLALPNHRSMVLTDAIKEDADIILVMDHKLLDEYLFSWEEIPGLDNVKLTDFLKLNYGVDWVKTAKIEKTNNDKTIMITYRKHFISLNLNNENTELNLKIDTDKTDNFNVKTENGKLEIYLNYIVNPNTYEKTQIFKEFFGLEGDIVDPWRLQEDETTAQRYDECAKDLKEVLGYNFENISRSLSNGKNSK